MATVRYPGNGKLMGDWRQAFHACSMMPRFGAKGILTETQITHFVGLLLDPASPVNQ